MIRSNVRTAEKGILNHFSKTIFVTAQGMAVVNVFMKLLEASISGLLIKGALLISSLKKLCNLLLIFLNSQL